MNASVIKSRQNPVFKDLIRLHTGRGIKKQGLALLSGEKLVREAVGSLSDRCVAWVTSGERMPVAPEGVAHHRLAPELFKVLDLFGTHSPLLVVRPPEIPSWNMSQGLPPGLSVLVPFQDPENVGAVIRSSVAFGADRIILLEESAHAFHPKALRASGGAVLRARFLTGPRIESVPEALPLTPLSKDGVDIAGYRFPDPCGLLPGLEGPGLPETWRKRAVAIPIRSEVESLNSAASVAVALYLWSRSRAGVE